MFREQICKAFFVATTIHRISTFPACTCCWPDSTANSTCKNCYQCVSRSSHSSRDPKTFIIQVTEERPFGSCTKVRGTPHGASSVCDSAVSLSSSLVGVHVHIHHLVQFRSAPSLSSAQLSASLRCNFTASSTSSNFRHSHLYFRLLTLYLIPGLENCHVRQRPCTPSYIPCRTALIVMVVTIPTSLQLHFTITLVKMLTAVPSIRLLWPSNNCIHDVPFPGTTVMHFKAHSASR